MRDSPTSLNFPNGDYSPVISVLDLSRSSSVSWRSKAVSAAEAPGVLSPRGIFAGSDCVALRFGGALIFLSRVALFGVSVAPAAYLAGAAGVLEGVLMLGYLVTVLPPVLKPFFFFLAAAALAFFFLAISAFFFFTLIYTL